MSETSNSPQVNLPPGLAQPAIRALAAAGCFRLEDVTRFSVAELSQMHGVGPRAIETLRRALAEKGLAFAGQENQSGG